MTRTESALTVVVLVILGLVYLGQRKLMADIPVPEPEPNPWAHCRVHPNAHSWAPKGTEMVHLICPVEETEE